MLIVGLILIMLVICMVLYKPGAKFFFSWLMICVAVFYFIRPSVGLWGFLMYFVVMPDPDADEKRRKRQDSFSSNLSWVDIESVDDQKVSGQRCSSRRHGDTTYFSNGNSSVHYGDVTYHDDQVRSVRNGVVTYFYDDKTGCELGHSVDRGNGVCNYIDVNGVEVGRSVTNGDITDYYGNCFEL